MAYAVLTDVADRLGRAISESDEVTQVNTWIADAERKIARRIPDLAPRILDAKITPEDVTMVVAQAVVRKVKNPDGKQNERVDDYSYGLVSDSAQAEIYITDEEWAILLTDTSASIEGAFTIRTVPFRPVGATTLTVDGWS